MIIMVQFFWQLMFVFVAALLISLWVTPLIRKTCQQRNLLDFPVLPRKIHSLPVPRLGGIAIYLAFFGPLFLIFLTGVGDAHQLFLRHLNLFLSLFVSSTLVFAVGVYDDLRGATVLQKLTVQFAAATLMYLLGFQIQLISVPFGGSMSLGLLGFPLTLLWLVGVTNAMNFTDGIDGLASGVGFFAVITIFILSLFLHNQLNTFFAVALAGGLLGFTRYNFAPASIFMGDSGSLFIGFVLAVISMYGSQKSSTAVVLLIPITVLGVPIVDTMLAIIRRTGNGHSPFTADREHIHHRLLRLGFSSRQVTLLLYAVCTLFGVTALAMTAVNNRLLTLLLVVLSVVAIGGMKWLGYSADMLQIHAQVKERIQRKKRLLRQYRQADEILAELNAVTDVASVKKIVRRYIDILEFDSGQLVFQEGEHGELTWQSQRCLEPQASAAAMWQISIPLSLNEQRYGELRIGKIAAPDTSLLEYLVFAEPLKCALEDTLARLARPSHMQRDNFVHQTLHRQQI